MPTLAVALSLSGHSPISRLKELIASAVMQSLVGLLNMLIGCCMTACINFRSLSLSQRHMLLERYLISLFLLSQPIKLLGVSSSSASSSERLCSLIALSPYTFLSPISHMHCPSAIQEDVPASLLPPFPGLSSCWVCPAERCPLE